MTTFVDRLFPAHESRDTVLRSGTQTITRAELGGMVEAFVAYLRGMGSRCVALYADNGPAWIAVDLACQQAGIRLVPVPLFFSAAQIRHTLETSGADTLMTDRAIDDGPVGEIEATRPARAPLDALRVYSLKRGTRARVPEGTQKITFTSGTTGTPKGVCLSSDQQVTVAASLAAAIGIDAPRHLCVLPLSTLLENVAGVYAPLIGAGTVIVPPLEDVGLVGSSQLDAPKLLGRIEREQPDSLILVPALLGALTTAAEGGWRPPSSLRFVAVGGGKVAPDLLRRARNVGLPVYEGYGLSECGSVVTLNVPAADRPGAVGRPLPHVEVTAEEGEIVVTGHTSLGYLDHPESWGQAAVRTGDLGHIDADGYVHIVGRVKNQLITSYGRNLSPEWIESELTAGPLLQQAVVVGDAQPRCAALLWPRHAATRDEDIADWVHRTNERLPDYARIADWRRLPGPMTRESGLLTDNGRPRRNEIVARHSRLIEELYGNHAEAGTQ